YIDRTLAIKLLREERCLDTENRLRFLREAKAAGNLSHPQIVTIHDIGEVENRPYIVMELLEGTTLEDMLNAGWEFSIGDTVAICSQLALALHYAHECGVVHRDIKPSNIVCTNSQKGKISVTITDFGIAHVTDSNLTQGTEAGALLGTPYNISPEQVLGTTVDGRADLFSLGITMYHLFSGQRPFIGTNLHTLLFQIATEDHRPITQIIPEFPLQLKCVIDKCLEKDPDDRFQSGQELVDELNQATQDISKRGAKKSKTRKISTAVKHSALLSLLLFVTMSASTFFVIKMQTQSQRSDLRQLGIGFSRYVAQQNTESVLRQDWLTVDLFIQHFDSPKQIQRIIITDHKDIIRGDSLQKGIGTKLQSDIKDKTGIKTDNVLVFSRQSNNPISIAGKTLPAWLTKLFNLGQYDEFYYNMSFGQRHVGKVIISFSPDISNQSVLNTLITLLALYILVLMTTLPAIFYFSRFNTKSLDLLKVSIKHITSGNYTQRIRHIPNNDIGDTYIAYNNMADKLQERDLRQQSMQQPQNSSTNFDNSL
ncbi:MAG: protein kinase, partial [Thiohalomonadales bacterium]